MRNPTLNNFDNQTFEISKDGNHSIYRLVPSSEITQALSNHYRENPSELEENRIFSFTYEYEPNGVDYKLKVASSESDKSESKALDRYGISLPISINDTKEQAEKFEEKRLEIKKAVINFFTENPDETLDSEDKIIVFNDNEIQIKPHTYKPSKFEQPIIIGDNTKFEITQKRLEMAQERLEMAQEKINQLESQRKEPAESTALVGMGVQGAIGRKFPVVTSWLSTLQRSPSDDSILTKQNPGDWLPPVESSKFHLLSSEPNQQKSDSPSPPTKLTLDSLSRGMNELEKNLLELYPSEPGQSPTKPLNLKINNRKGKE